MTKQISILGSTGSIGVQTLDLVRRHPQKFAIAALVAGNSIEELAKQILEFKPALAVTKTSEGAQKLKSLISNQKTEILFGEEGAIEAAKLPQVHTVISAIVGASGLLPTLAALKAGKTVGLANKESMVIAGELMNRVRAENKAVILPVDSEHSALFQCLQGHGGVKKLILTASGGPFLNLPQSEFQNITKAQALKHPNWNMGPKITIDSATMMNKGLEVMEACQLFEVPPSQVEVCVHPQSIVHSMVEYIDGSVLAHLGLPDMRVPIAYALSYPERIETGVGSLKLWEKRELTFYPPDFEKFPCLRLAFEVAKSGETYPAVLNAANEVAVAAFLNDQIRFIDIPAILEKTISAHKPEKLKTLEQILAADAWARQYAEKLS